MTEPSFTDWSVTLAFLVLSEYQQKKKRLPEREAFLILVGELYYQVQQIEKNKEVHTNLW